MRDDKGNIGHAEVKVGTSILMLGKAHDQWKSRPGNFYVYVEDCDAIYQKALDAGRDFDQQAGRPVLWRSSGGVTDSQGNNWWIATHVEDISEDDMKRAAEEHQKKQAEAAKK